MRKVSDVCLEKEADISSRATLWRGMKNRGKEDSPWRDESPEAPLENR